MKSMNMEEANSKEEKGQNESKQEYDIAEEEIGNIEKLTTSKLLGNIGYGGFSIVKLIFNYQQKNYFAMKVVKLLN